MTHILHCEVCAAVLTVPVFLHLVFVFFCFIPFCFFSFFSVPACSCLVPVRVGFPFLLFFPGTWAYHCMDSYVNIYEQRTYFFFYTVLQPLFHFAGVYLRCFMFVDFVRLHSFFKIYWIFFFSCTAHNKCTSRTTVFCSLIFLLCIHAAHMSAYQADMFYVSLSGELLPLGKVEATALATLCCSDCTFLSRFTPVDLVGFFQS